MALTKITSSGITDSAINTNKIADNTILNEDINANANISPAKFGLTTPPTIVSLSTTEIDDDTGGSVTITGTGFVAIPEVTLVNTTNGSIVTASSVTFTSATSLTAAIPSGGGSGIYKLRVQNPDGLAVQGTDNFTYSSNPNWVTASGSLGTVAVGAAVSFTVSAFGDDSTAVTFSETTSVLTSNANTPTTTMNLSLNSTTGAITGTAPTPTGNTTYSFTLRATDAESQTTDRAFTITITAEITERGQFN